MANTIGVAVPVFWRNAFTAGVLLVTNTSGLSAVNSCA